ncbi:hypothetical protein JB92DRAFT_2828489 [Gautieria morchelliformis]|nr:hypothetical protein JB92DRAFT_2828489 [Gautieria morchelliformis]
MLSTGLPRNNSLLPLQDRESARSFLGAATSLLGVIICDGGDHASATVLELDDDGNRGGMGQWQDCAEPPGTWPLVTLDDVYFDTGQPYFIVPCDTTKTTCFKATTVCESWNIMFKWLKFCERERCTRKKYFGKRLGVLV